MQASAIEKFNADLWDFYATHKRILPWRETISPYGIAVSEIMLQQTQVSRVLEKYPVFMKTFPDFPTLAQASFVDVLSVWQGMGYNRRAKYLQEIAKRISFSHRNIVPDDPSLLETFPGIGPATARSIVTFIYNTPQIFIETNIRRVFIHHFFEDTVLISDKEIVPLIEHIIDKYNPREWYYALMDYGATLPKHVVNPNRKSKHYTKQSKFEGSRRQMRGKILKELLAANKLDRLEIADKLGYTIGIIYPILQELHQEGFVQEKKGKYMISP
ncbi:A/G-specific adenine glycosylase [Candidatus Woesebacteria bacterium]|nr:A/G-specific adenine glycosylase [Candidatus Woesebacteria bacterium]